MAAARSATDSQPNRDLSWFPDQTLVSPPLADPRGPYTQGLVQSYHADRPVQDDLFDGLVAEGDVGFDYPLFGWMRSRSREYQVSFEGGIYSDFLGEGDNAQDLVSIDYRVGFTLEGERGSNRYRLHLYHESSHLGDEFAENTGRSRIRWSREALRLVYFRDFNRRRWELYGGGEYNFRREQTDIDRSALIAGFLRRFPYQLYMTADARFRQYADYDPFVTLQFGRHLFGGAMTVAVQYREGPLPVGQFYQEERSSFGVMVRINGPNPP